jgi:hypothetical protein
MRKGRSLGAAVALFHCRRDDDRAISLPLIDLEGAAA